MKISSLDLIIAGCDDGKRILMIDMDGCEIRAEKFSECIRTGLQAVSHLIQAINKMRDSCGRQKRQVTHPLTRLLTIDLLYLSSWYPS